MSARTVIRYSVVSGRKLITRDELEKLFGRDRVDSVIRSLSSKRVLRAVIRGRVYYVFDYNDRVLGLASLGLDVLGKALDLLGVGWLITGMWALRIRGVSYEEPRVVWIFNDRFRHTVKSFSGYSVRFFKVRRSLLGFGFERLGELNVADTERAVLDIIYTMDTLETDPREWRYIVAGLLKPCRAEKLEEYLPRYPRYVREMVEHGRRVAGI